MSAGSIREKLLLLNRTAILKKDGDFSFHVQNYIGAIICYNQAIDICPKSRNMDLAILHHDRASAYEMLEMWNQVRDDCSKSLEYNPFYALSYFSRAKAHEFLNNLTDCLDDLTAALAIETFNNHEGFEKTTKFRDRIAEVVGLSDATKYIETRKHTLPSAFHIKRYFQSFVCDTVNRPMFKVGLAKGYMRAKTAFKAENFEEVIPACSEEIESIDSDDERKVKALLLRGTFYVLSGNFEQGMMDFNAVINSRADDVIRANAFVKRGRLRIQLNDKEQGFSDFDEAERIFPNYPDLYYGRGDAYFILGQYTNALKNFEETLRRMPSHSFACVKKLTTEYCLAKESGKHKHFLILICSIEKAIKRFPDRMELYTLLNEVFIDLGRYDEADLNSTKAIRLSPKTPDLYVFRGQFLMHWKNDNRASIKFMNMAIEIDDKCVSAYQELGIIETEHRNVDRGIQFFDKAISNAKVPADLSYLFKLRSIAVAEKNVGQKFLTKKPISFDDDW